MLSKSGGMALNCLICKECGSKCHWCQGLWLCLSNHSNSRPPDSSSTVPMWCSDSDFDIENKVFLVYWSDHCSSAGFMKLLIIKSRGKNSKMGELQERSQESKDLASVTATCEAILLLLVKILLELSVRLLYYVDFNPLPQIQLLMNEWGITFTHILYYIYSIKPKTDPANITENYGKYHH